MNWKIFFDETFPKDEVGTEIVKTAQDFLHHDTFKVVLLALAEVGTAWILSSLAKRWCEKVAEKSLNKGFMTFLGSFVSIAIKVVGIIISLDQLGVSMNVIVGAMSGLGVGVALALKSNMAAVASGLQILLTKPFKVGDYISIGTFYGTVTSIELTFTTLQTNDNESVVIPNNNFLSNNMVNYSSRPTIRCVLNFPCNSNEIKYYLDRLALCAMDCPLVQKNPQPVARVDQYLSGGTVNLKLIYYADTNEYWQTYDQVTAAVSTLFKQVIPETAPERDASEPSIPKAKDPASVPKAELQSAKEMNSPDSPQNVKKEIKQLVSDILPIPLPGMPAQTPLKNTLQQLFKNAGTKHSNQPSSLKLKRQSSKSSMQSQSDNEEVVRNGNNGQIEEQIETQSESQSESESSEQVNVQLSSPSDNQNQQTTQSNTSNAAASPETDQSVSEQTSPQAEGSSGQNSESK